MERIVARAGIWFAVVLLAVMAAATARDAGFAVHMIIVAAAALIGLWFAISKPDFTAVLSGIMPGKPDQSQYDDDPVRWGVIATVFWSIVGFVAGLAIALQLAYPLLNLEPYLSFGRLRPLHTSGVVFAFGGNVLIATSFYIVQRTCRARLAFPALARFVFWGYQLFIVLAATGVP